MEMIFLILLFLVGGSWEAEVPETGVLGEEVRIECTHANAFSNVKYFCKGACANEDVLIRSEKNKNDSNEKYSITDEGDTFYVTIFDLTEDDSGTYWCGIDRYGLDTYKKVILTVVEGNTKDPDNDINNLPQSNSNEKILKKTSEKLVYIGVGLGVVVVALVTALLIFLRHRSGDTSTSFGKAQDTVYATPSDQKEDAHDITMSSSAATDDRGTDGRTETILDTSRDHGDNIYSNISASSEPQVQPDGLLYSTISFNKHCSNVTPRTAAVTYSTLNHMSAEDSTVYCNDEASAGIINQQEENVCSVSRPSIETGDQHTTEGIHLLNTTVCFSTEAAAQPRRQTRSAAGPSGVHTTKNHGAHHYEEIQMPNQQASSGDAPPSVYATVNLPADQLNYASVNFQKDPLTVSDSNENGSSACDYSVCKTQVATHPPAAEQTVYSIVTKPQSHQSFTS
ncbi:uncharacterized protein [Pempheris klunzingeri]|uniref:uncharacterized protein n=1 Tax=Pempheris klunzingeri TaxID=3127111 RepID=UPI00397F11C3